MTTGLISTVFGNGPARAQRRRWVRRSRPALWMPDAIFLDAHDNLYVGEKYGYRARWTRPRALSETLVGNGVPGFGEEGLPGEETHCNSVEVGLWVDPDGAPFGAIVLAGYDAAMRSVGLSRPSGRHKCA
ncbi:MAG: hypothetical protein R3E79_45410 [Caldilineaceae bacterium]